MIRLSLNFRGRVQGVGFRATTRDVAALFPVTGWVRNDPDASVTCEVQGAGDDVEMFLLELLARMDRHIRDVTRADASVQAGEQGFEIRR